MRRNLFLIILGFGLITAGCESDEDPITSNPAVKGGTIDAEVGGPEQPNQVYIDLSRNKSTAIARADWDLGFYNGDQARVIINSSNGMLAYKLDKNNIFQVNETDTVGLGAQLSLDAIFGALFGPPVPWLAETPGWVDDPARNISNTAIDAISATDDQNMVYIVNRGENPDGSQRGWKKIRIIQISNGYELQYADIASNNISYFVVSKAADFNFSFFGFENGGVNVEPRSNNWDLAFTTWTELTSFGSDPIPYFFLDFVIINQEKVKVAEVVDDQTQNILEVFNNFNQADVAGLTFESDANAIGSSWRTVASPTPGSVTAVKNDRFYVIEDGDGNQYKLIFTKMLNDQGERGYPQILFDKL